HALRLSLAPPPPPPRSPPFPYTTLFRSRLASQEMRTSESTEELVARLAGVNPSDIQRVARDYLRPERALTAIVGPPARRSRSGRSEEHTSELQSRRDLVCRLPLE